MLAVEPEPHLRALAEQAAARAPVPVTVVDGMAEALPVGDCEFDTAVITLVLCSVADQPGALRELRRVLRPGGRLVFWEHVRGERPPLTLVQDALDRTVWPLVCGGCHVGRDTAAEITAAGFTVERIERCRMPDTRIPLPWRRTSSAPRGEGSRQFRSRRARRAASAWGVHDAPR